MKLHVFAALLGATASMTLNAFGSEDEVATNALQYRFKYERFTADNGALYRTPGFATNYDDDVFALMVDSSNRVWVGTVTGLAVYDGKGWIRKTFRIAAPPALRLGLRLLTGTDSCGPHHFAEGPPGTIWLGGSFGVWREHDSRCEELTSDNQITGMLDMAVDRVGGLWVVDRFRLWKYDGKNWTMVMCPYIGKPRSYEAAGFRRIAIETNGNVWIGATAYLEQSEPWEHEGSVWLVDQDHRKRNGGPPMAPLFEFDGKRWKAFGAPHGLKALYKGAEDRPYRRTPRGWAEPRLDPSGRILAETPNGYFIREGETWKSIEAPNSSAGKRWILRDTTRWRINGFKELVFIDGDKLIQVRAADPQTGKEMLMRERSNSSLFLWTMAEDQARRCVWLGTSDGLYKIWRDE